ncbi:MAG: hypothetical protein HY537_09540 [Deltaproteobacteria bacterium]|nr:hypothetical protein [Deltaproteobacteria bacterium]
MEPGPTRPKLVLFHGEQIKGPVEHGPITRLGLAHRFSPPMTRTKMLLFFLPKIAVLAAAAYFIWG